MNITMVKEMVKEKEILKKEVVRVDVVEMDELMAYSKDTGERSEFDGRKVGVMEEKWRSL